MANSQRRLILANGEQYVLDEPKNTPGRSTEPPRSFEEARLLLNNGVTTALQTYTSLPKQKRVDGEAFLCLRLHPDATAKSYDPTTVFEEVPEITPVGSRNYSSPIAQVAQTKRIKRLISEGETKASGRMIFIRSSDLGYRRLLDRINLPESRLSETFRNEIRRIEAIDLLDATEQRLGIDQSWAEGRCELVMHPSRITQDRQRSFLFELFEFSGVDVGKSKVRQYSAGITFVSCFLTRSMLDVIIGTNPLRSAHPLAFGGLENLRTATNFPAPNVSGSSTRSTIKVGMFDGGIAASHPYLDGHAEEDEALSIKVPADEIGIAHGTAVAGALLYGALNGVAQTERLPVPPVYVVSFRALPTSDASDIDLYESIDVIENAVPARPDIKVFNISFGPRGPVLDDTLSRFTYALDTLAISQNVTFYCAVGNDGDQVGLDRVQSPSDLVHGIGVGAYTFSGEKKVHASYSCKGPGRECAKIKPDIAAFGGCENNPIHLLAVTNGAKTLSAGTSFASPLAARVGAQASNCFDRATSLLGRALVVHTAVHPDNKPDHLLGHGCVVPQVSDLLTCNEKSVTVVFSSGIIPTKTIRLPIPIPASIKFPGRVAVTWTVAALSQVDPTHPGDYTCCCIDDTFYPHSQVYAFTKNVDPKGNRLLTKKVNVVSEEELAASLLRDGWLRSKIPASISGNQYRDEDDRRAIDCKWEPLVRRFKRMEGTSINEPFLLLHAIPRHKSADMLQYVAIVTISAPKYDGDLYSEVREQYPALSPIRLRAEAELRVQI